MINFIYLFIYLSIHSKIFLNLFLFLERGEGREKEMETSMCRFLSCAPYWGPGTQPRNMACLGIEQVILWLAD